MECLARQRRGLALDTSRSGHNTPARDMYADVVSAEWRHGAGAGIMLQRPSVPKRSP